MSELAHMRKLYNDIIYFVQNHVKPVAPSNSYPSSLLNTTSSSPLVHKPLNQLMGYYHHPPPPPPKQAQIINSPTATSQSSLTYLEEPNTICKTKLFGVPLHSKKRLHPSSNGMETNKARLVLDKDDLGLNLMPSSTC